MDDKPISEEHIIEENINEEPIVKQSGKNYVTEICLSGACNRGISYLGCFKKMEGTSIGTFVGICYVLGYSTSELLKIIIEKDMKNFKDISFEKDGAVLKGDQYKNWVFDVLSKKIDPNITLAELYKKTNITFVASTTCIHSTNKDFGEGLNYLSHITAPKMPLIIAINCSMAFPFIFPPVIYEGGHFIDGGVLDNFPVNIVSSSALGLRVNFKTLDGSISIKNPISYVGKIYELMSLRFSHLINKNLENTINIDCGDFDLIEFDMSIDDKITLYKRGYSAMSDFLNC